MKLLNLGSKFGNIYSKASESKNVKSKLDGTLDFIANIVKRFKDENKTDKDTKGGNAKG